MFPWGHLAFGYVLYSLTRRALGVNTIAGREVIVLALATQLPDLVDKPLSWSLSVFPSGYAVAHSVFVAVPLGLAALAVGWKYDRVRLGLAVLVGWWSHLVGDVMLAVLTGGAYTVTRVLWPVVVLPGSHSELSFVEKFVYYVGEFIELLGSSAGPYVFAIYFGPLLLAAILWLADGAPVVRELWDWAADPH
ncbi:metal-dependent hydrolase [Halomicroarcula limicola]|uniref:Metal-dependent hydrolase n=1 Tax=Haloarcula limicola TaxID=1429915 RepID=A0A8J8C4E4_9EURY|nr:metal-dependent hydrolase [Halomicroarcula limicola]MBV0925466.1 metal-dependent hydrolase [Halomicroarcula limicola]